MQTPKSQQDHPSGTHVSRAAATTVSGKNSVASFQAPAQPVVAPEQPAQLKKCEVNVKNPKTTVEWVDGKLNGSDEPVGMYMEATNLHKGNVGGGELIGTPPKTAAQKDLMAQLPTQPSLKLPDKYIKGHLLNHNIGGPGLDFNMFPITGSANKAHHTFVEKDVKAWVNAQKLVDYKVKVDSIKDESKNGKKKGKVDAVFRCYAKNLTDNKEISQDIPSTLGLKEDPKDNDKNKDMNADDDVVMDTSDSLNFQDGSWLAWVYSEIGNETDSDKVETNIDKASSGVAIAIKNQSEKDDNDSRTIMVKKMLTEMFGNRAVNLTTNRQNGVAIIIKEIIYAFIINNDDGEQEEYENNYPSLMAILNSKKD